MVLTSWPLPVESLRTYLLTELALKMSFSVVLLIGTVPSGQDSPESAHSWKLSETASVEL